MKTSARTFLRVLLVATLAGLGACGDDARDLPDAAPRLLPLEAHDVAVNDTLRVALPVDNPSGLALSFTWRGPDLPGLDRAVRIAGTVSGGEFTYSPLASHVGAHEFVITLESALGASRQSLRVRVTPGAAAAPIFLRPGSGGAFDLTQDPVVNVAVEVRDEDSAEVTVRVASGLPEGAEWTVTGPKSAHLEWRPTPQQLDTADRWPILFEADDGDHPPTQHEYLAVLRRQPKDGCPGDAPVVAVQAPTKGAEIVARGGYDVTFTATDDQGLKDNPVVYWIAADRSPTEAFDLAEFAVVPSRSAGPGAFVARIPSVGLAPGARQVISFVVSATDNDDPNGTACDHRTDTAIHRFIAVGSDGGTLDPLCTLCGLSDECATGLCALTALGGVCLRPCDDSACAAGVACVAATSAEGGVRQACGTETAQCPALFPGGGGACAPDPFEPNDTPGSATVARPDDVFEGRVCPGDVDVFGIDLAANTRVTVELAPADDTTGDLDLVLRDADAQPIALSANADAYEELSYCAARAGRVSAEVYGYGGHTGPYYVAFATASESCCVDDPGEPDDTPATAQALAFPGLAEGMICPNNADFFRVRVPAAGPATVTLVSTSPDVDLDVHVFGPAGHLVAAGEALGDERVTFAAAVGDHFLRVVGYGGATGSYLVEMLAGGTTACAGDADCPLATVCHTGTCVDAYCATAADCPVGHGCPYPGPLYDLSLCGAPCTADAQCRPGEACKVFPEGRFCGIVGEAASGAPCESFLDCAGQQACLDWPGGYCARAQCQTTADCDAGTRCVRVGADLRCAVDCAEDEAICRVAAGYACDLAEDELGEIRFVCIP